MRGILQSIIKGRVTSKTTKYAEFVSDHGSSFVPFIMLSTGGLADDAIDLLWKISNHAAVSFSYYTATSFFNYSIAQLSGVLQDGNYIVNAKGIAIALREKRSH